MRTNDLGWRACQATSGDFITRPVEVRHEFIQMSGLHSRNRTMLELGEGVRGGLFMANKLIGVCVYHAPSTTLNSKFKYTAVTCVTPKAHTGHVTVTIENR